MLDSSTGLGCWGHQNLAKPNPRLGLRLGPGQLQATPSMCKDSGQNLEGEVRSAHSRTPRADRGGNWEGRGSWRGCALSPGPEGGRLQPGVLQAGRGAQADSGFSSAGPERALCGDPQSAIPALTWLPIRSGEPAPTPEHGRGGCSFRGGCIKVPEVGRLPSDRHPILSFWRQPGADGLGASPLQD